MTKKNELPGLSVGYSKPTANQARSRASKALSNARQRCTNLNNPDFPLYGGKGILVFFKDVDQLIANIGLPKEHHSLDRIDPHGHYEPGNVRWANAAVQAANKKSSSGNSYLSTSAQVAAAKDALVLSDNRKRSTIGWMKALKAFNEGHLPSADAEWLAQHIKRTGAIEANFDFDTVFDQVNVRPGYMHLPALSLPNERVRIRAWPALKLPVPSHVGKFGRLGGLENLEAEWNTPGPLWERTKNSINNRATGLVLHGMPKSADLLGGWIEGACLGMAGAIYGEFGIQSACYPMLRVNKMLHDLGRAEHWDEIDHIVLDARVLLIPDFSLDCGAWSQDAKTAWWKVGDLLRYRHDAGHHTILGVQNLGKLPHAVRELVLGAYEHVRMPRAEAHDLIEMDYATVTYGVPEGSTAIRRLRLDPATEHLVNDLGY